MTVNANGFDWDQGNRAKCEKHGFPWRRLQAFLPDRGVLPDAAHSQREKRFRAIGHTDKGRGVLIVFMFRKKRDEVLIRPISARYMHQKEVGAYEKENPNL